MKSAHACGSGRRRSSRAWKSERVLLDLRTVEPEQEAVIVAALESLSGANAPST